MLAGLVLIFGTHVEFGAWAPQGTDICGEARGARCLNIRVLLNHILFKIRSFIVCKYDYMNIFPLLPLRNHIYFR